MAEEIPRLFQLRTTVGDHIGDVSAHGVQWPDGTISIRWPDLAESYHWRSFEDPAAAIVHTAQVTVVWLRQDTYADPGGPT